MNNLSKDLISYIYQYISLNDIYNCSIVNKQFNKAFHHELLWKNLCNPYEEYIDKYMSKIKKSHQEIYKKIIEDINLLPNGNRIITFLCACRKNNTNMNNNI